MATVDCIDARLLAVQHCVYVAAQRRQLRGVLRRGRWAEGVCIGWSACVRLTHADGAGVAAVPLGVLLQRQLCGVDCMLDLRHAGLLPRLQIDQGGHLVLVLRSHHGGHALWVMGCDGEESNGSFVGVEEGEREDRE